MLVASQAASSDEGKEIYIFANLIKVTLKVIEELDLLD